jgi:hypothetical protein
MAALPMLGLTIGSVTVELASTERIGTSVHVEKLTSECECFSIEARAGAFGQLFVLRTRSAWMVNGVHAM